jgi:hypothetical protein
MVRIVVDREFGERLAELRDDVPVWIVGSSDNTAVVQRLRAERQTQDHLTGITVFNDFAGTAADLLRSQLDNVDLHHGVYSANPPCTVLEVIGVELDQTIELSLSPHGFTRFMRSPLGFIGTRPLPGE